MKNLESSMTNLLEARQKKISTLELALKEASEEKVALQQNVELLKIKVRKKGKSQEKSLPVIAKILLS